MTKAAPKEDLNQPTAPGEARQAVSLEDKATVSKEASTETCSRAALPPKPPEPPEPPGPPNLPALPKPDGRRGLQILDTCRDCYAFFCQMVERGERAKAAGDLVLTEFFARVSGALYDTLQKDVAPSVTDVFAGAALILEPITTTTEPEPPLPPGEMPVC